MPAARLLVVEDEAEAGRQLKSGLGEAAFAVESRPGAEAARAALSQNGYQLMLPDLRLPGQDGREFLADLRAAGAALRCSSRPRAIPSITACAAWRRRRRLPDEAVCLQ